MKGNIKYSNQSFYKILITLISTFILISIIIFLRTNKKVILHNLNESFLMIFPNISSVDNLLENKGGGIKSFTKRQKLIAVSKYLINFYKNIDLKSSKERDLIPILDIKIPFKSLNKIYQDRDNAIGQTFLNKSQWTKGSIKYGQDIKKIDLRLKGHLGDHWSADKKYSLKIKFKKNKADFAKPNFLGLHNFSIHKLSARQYPYDYIFQEALKELGFIYTDNKFAKVKVNNDYWGIMNVQENIGESIFARNKIKESIILKFNDNLYWRDYFTKSKNIIPRKDYWLSHPRIFVSLKGRSEKKLTPDEIKKLYYVKNVLLDKNYQEILFDQKLLSQSQILLSIWGNSHAFETHNLNFYLNPFTLKLEPIMNDQSSFQILKKPISIFKATNGFLKSKGFKNKEVKEFGKKTLKIIENKTNDNSNIYFPSDKPLNLSILKNNYENIINSPLAKDDSLDSKENIYSDRIKCINKNYQIPENFPLIEANYNSKSININPLICGKIKIKKVRLCDKSKNYNFEIYRKSLNIHNPIKLKLSDYEITKIENDFCKNKKNTIYFDVEGKKNSASINYLPIISKKINPLINQSKPKFIKNIGDDSYLIKSGTWLVQEPIVLKGDLKIEKGTILEFSPNSYLIINGSINAKGDINEKVIMKSKEINQYWKGLYVYNLSNSKTNSYLQNVLIENTEHTNVGILNLTGGVTFYNTDVNVNNLLLNNSKAEDSINFVRSKVFIEGIKIKNSLSDGLDCDFCLGEISGVSLNKIGGDGLDFSGSIMKVNINKAYKIFDKVLSIGEETKIEANLNNIKESYLAVAVKDGSNAIISLNNVQTNGPKVMAYDKKDYFKEKTTARVFTGISQKEFSDDFITSEEADLFVNQIKYPSSIIDLNQLYKFGRMKKLK